MEIIENIFSSWKIANWVKYFCLVLVFSVIVRTVLSCMQALHWAPKGLKKEALVDSLRGYPRAERREYYYKKVGDHWQAFFVGLVELTMFPVLIKANQSSFLIAWLTFKVIGHYEGWKTDRRPVNRFLVGTGLNLIIATWIAFNIIKPIGK